LRRHGRVGILVRQDRMDAVAVCTDWREAVAPRNALPMNAGHEFLLHIGVALAAGAGNVELVDGRLGVVGGNNFMRSVTVSADGGFCRALLHRSTVHALLIRKKRLGALAVRLHEELLAVATTAGSRDVGVIHRRFRIVDGKDLVRSGMAVFATRRRTLS